MTPEWGKRDQERNDTGNRNRQVCHLSESTALDTRSLDTAIYLLAHGLVNAILMRAVLSNRLWAYLELQFSNLVYFGGTRTF